MEFRIADTFVDSLAKLTNQEQKQVKQSVFDMQIDPSHPGLQYHKLDKAKDSRFASVRVNRDIRVIVHRSKNSFLVCYVDHHDEAYDWAMRRKLEQHPKTGAAQLVEIREEVREVIIPSYVVEERPKPKLFDNYSDDALLSYGVPPEWLDDVRKANEDTLLDLADHLPAEAAEALLELAVGGKPEAPVIASPQADPWEHPDALRRFRVMSEIEELQRALEYPWEKWTVFLHPKQEEIVTADYGGPARVYGSAGTGKTVVALHRAVHLATENPNSRVLLTTFSKTLANALQTKLTRLLHNKPRLGEQIEVFDLNSVAERLYRRNFGEFQIATREQIARILSDAARQVNTTDFGMGFIVDEWIEIVDAWQVKSFGEYRNVQRLGRKTRLSESHREKLWSIFELALDEMNRRGLMTYAGLFGVLTDHYTHDATSPFGFIVVDEAQDINVAQLKFLSALLGDKPNGLFFAGDQGQRIFQLPFSWMSLGVDIRGRSKGLRINYRTSHQIRMKADKLLNDALSDVDGITESRGGTISVFNGPEPVIMRYETNQDEINGVAEWILDRVADGIEPEEIGIIVRSESEILSAQESVEKAGVSYKVLDERVATTVGKVSLCTMHLAKGLEFKAVVVMACNEEIIPSQKRIEAITDTADVEEVYNTERHLLYVACTRARDALFVTCVKPGSEFLDDLTL